MFAIGRVFEHLERRHERDLQARGITLRTQVEADADQVTGDPDRLEQALQNLVSNALRHTPAGGTIDVQARIEDSHLLLSVIDSGTGIGAAHLAHVFDRFYKIDPARAAGTNGEPGNGQGSGLGLSIVKAIVERHGGTIDATSVPGRTEFRISLPQSSTNL